MKRLFTYLVLSHFYYFLNFVSFNVDMVDTEKPILNRVGLI